jgi:hypothetical protein
MPIERGDDENFGNKKRSMKLRWNPKFKTLALLMVVSSPFLNLNAAENLYILRENIQRDEAGTVQKKYILKLKSSTLKRLEKLPGSSRIYLGAREEKEKSNRKAHQREPDIHFKYSQSFLNIEGTEGQQAGGTLKTESSPGYHVVWTAYRRKRLDIQLGHSFSFYDFGKAESRVLKDPKQEMQNFFISGNYRLSNELVTSLELGAKKQFFFRAVDASTIEIDNVTAPYYQVSLQYDAYRIDRTHIKFKGGFRHHLPFETNVFKGSGTGVIGSLLIEHKTKKLNLSGEIFYSRDFFDTTPIEFTRAESGLIFGMQFNFGDEA